MSIEQHKQIASSFCERFSAGDIQGVLDTLSDDVDYWILGRRDVIPSSGQRDKARITRVFNAMCERLEGNLRMTVKSAIAEGDRVAMEVESYGTLKNGRIYNNQYHMMMRIDGGKIVEVHEYLDTQHVLATWYS
jgi:uncharacterized protein